MIRDFWSLDEHQLRVESFIIKVRSEVRQCGDEVLLQLFEM